MKLFQAGDRGVSYIKTARKSRGNVISDSDISRKRMKVVIATVLMLFAVLIVLRLSSCVMRSVQIAEVTNKSIRHEEGGDTTLPDAMSALLFPSDGFVVVGCSVERRLVALESAQSYPMTVMTVDQGMRARGWEPLPSSVQGVLAFGHAGQWDDERLSDGASLTAVTYALIVIQDMGGSVSVLAQFA